jgi:carbon starvation protein
MEAAIEAGTITGPRIAEAQAVIFNARLDAVVCALFVVLVSTILVDSLRQWAGLLRGTRPRHVAEAPFVLSRLRPEDV